MNKLILTLLLGIGVNTVWSQSTTFNLYFNRSQTEVLAKQKLELEKLAYKFTKPTRITIVPLVFDVNRNTWIYSANSEKQVNSIISYAKYLGFKVIGSPENFPSGYYGRSRSVVLQVIPGVKPIDRSCKDLENLRNPLLPLFGVKPSQYFTIDPLKDTILYGNEGTVLFFKAKSLLAKDSVQVELKEYYSLADYVKSALPSVSNGKLLETGGTIYLDAKLKKNPTQKVALNKAKGVGIDFTIGKSDDEMSVFYRDKRSPSKLNWVQQGKRKVSITKKWSMTETKLGPDGEVLYERVFHSKDEWNKYRDSLGMERKKEEARVKKEGEKRAALAKNRKEMEGKLKAFDLGLINCDKFYNEETAPFAFKKTDTMNTAYYLVFTDIRGVLNGNVDGTGRVSFGNIPKNASAHVLAVSYTGGKAYFDKEKINTASTAVSINMQVVSKSSINAELAALN